MALLFPSSTFFRPFNQLVLALLFSVGITTGAWAQAIAPAGYTFLTMTSSESQVRAYARIFIVPAFQGKSEIQLEYSDGFSGGRNMERLQRNTQLVNQQLEALTVAGWELVHVYPVSDKEVLVTRYLFRKVK